MVYDDGLDKLINIIILKQSITMILNFNGVNLV